MQWCQCRYRAEVLFRIKSIESVWIPITRYDTAHQFVHRDDLKPDGSQIKSPPMAFASDDDALNYAIRDLRLNSQWYIERYLRWKS
jgi:hypothetical protein